MVMVIGKAFQKLTPVVGNGYGHRITSDQQHGDSISVQFPIFGSALRPASPEPISVQARNMTNLMSQDEPDFIVTEMRFVQQFGGYDDHGITGKCPGRCWS